MSFFWINHIERILYYSFTLNMKMLQNFVTFIRDQFCLYLLWYFTNVKHFGFINPRLLYLTHTFFFLRIQNVYKPFTSPCLRGKYMRPAAPLIPYRLVPVLNYITHILLDHWRGREGRQGRRTGQHEKRITPHFPFSRNNGEIFTKDFVIQDRTLWYYIKF